MATTINIHENGNPTINFIYDSVSIKRQKANPAKLDVTIKNFYIKQPEAGKYFDFNYKVFLAVEHKTSTASTYTTVGKDQTWYAIYDRHKDSADTIEVYNSQSAIPAENPKGKKLHAVTIDGIAFPGYWSEFDAPYKLLEKPRGADKWYNSAGENVSYGGQYPKNKITSKTFTVDIDVDTNDVNILVVGDSDPLWVSNYDSKAGCYVWQRPWSRCTCNHTTTGVLLDKSITPYYTAPETSGSISVSDRKDNYVTITIPSFTAGINNTIASQTATIKFSNKSTGAKISEISGTFGTHDYAIPSCYDEVKVEVTATAQGGHYASDTADSATMTGSGTVIYYSAPNSPTTLTYASNGKSGPPDFGPRINKDLTWTWSGASRFGNVAANNIQGYRIRIYRENTNAGKLYSKTAQKLTSPEFNKTNGENEPCYDTTATSLTFNPKREGFKGTDKCTCSVQAYSKNGKDTVLYSSPAKAVVCTLKNSAVIWVKTKETGETSATWKEGVPYICISSAEFYANGNLKTPAIWKEAESAHVKTADTVWSEST